MKWFSCCTPDGEPYVQHRREGIRINYYPERKRLNISGKLIRLLHDMHDGTWINYIKDFIPVYIGWMLFCLISYQWLVGWVLGTYLFLRLSYLRISGQEL